MTAARQQRVAFVTGGASGIGRITAELFLQRGYAVALVDLDGERGRDAQRQLDAAGPCIFIHCDVADDESVRRAVAQTAETYGRLDVAFNNAGIEGDVARPTAEVSLEDWDRVIAVDLTGVFYCMRHQIPQMLKSGGGAIVNCSSIAGGVTAAPNMPAYVAAKHGLIGLTRGAALEYAREGIRVNAVSPGMIDTPLNRKAIPPDLAQKIIAASAIGRFGLASEIAATVLWLCEEGSSFVVGQNIVVDGGFTVA